MNQLNDRRPAVITIILRATREYLLPLVALSSGIFLVWRVLHNNPQGNPLTPFWMVLAGALVFGFAPVLLRNLIALTYERPKLEKW
jgi:drug/metabolite transporter (DMT)-like permease